MSTNKEKCSVCGQEGFHKLSCPNNNHRYGGIPVKIVKQCQDDLAKYGIEND